MRLMKRWLSGLLCLVLLLGLLPTAALAEGESASWADPAVKVLNEIYGSNIFSASDETMDTDDAQTVLNNMGRSDLTAPNPFNRAAACEILADVFALPVGEGSAITYLYKQNIVNGKSEGELGAEKPVSFAEFAVLTYRVLNFVGGGKGSSVAELKPGTEAYFAWMYLAARRCVAFKQDHLNDTIDNVTDFTTYDDIGETEYTDGSIVVEVKTTKKNGENIWNAWVAALSEPKIGGLDGFGDSLTEQYDKSETMKEAATWLMGAFISEYTEQKGSAPTIFTDVTMSDWWYDGVMYSFDAGYINGLGNGTFEPEYRLPLYEFAALLYRINPVDDSELASINLPFLDNLGQFSEYEQNVMGNPVVQKAMKAAVKAGYLSWVNGENEDFDPTDTVARGNAIADILKACVDGKNIGLDLSSVNTAILDRFSDTNGLSEIQKQYLAYAVSCGMVNGTSPTTLAPDAPVSRADAGVLLYRTLIGLDKTKMKDYGDSVNYAKGEESAQTFALLAADPAPAAVETKTLTLREDWRLTDELDLAVPEGTTLTIDGQGKYHIYEMGGTLQNSGLGKVVFAKDTETTKGTILYPLGNSGVCDPASSDALMEQRQPHKVTVAPSTNGTVAADKSAAKAADTVTLTVTPDSGYELASLSVITANGTQITVTSNTFTMPAADVTVSASFRTVSGGGPIGGGSGGTSGVNGSGDNVSISPSGGSVTSSQMGSAVKKADEGSTITIKATSSTTVTLPVGGMAEAADNHNDIVVDLRSGEVVLSARAVASMTDGTSASGRVEVVINSQTNSKDETISDLMDKGAAVFDVSVEVDGKSIHSFDGDLTISLTVSNLSKISDPHILHILTDGSKEYYAPDSISGNTITVKGIRNLSTFAVIPGSEVPKEPANPFTDVYESDYYYDAVLWAVENGVTNGTSATTFNPNMAVSRAQMVTFLWRAHGSPKATSTNPFTDVSTSDYYYDAVLWAVANGVTNGTSATTFGPDMAVTRAQAVTFQWRAAGSPVVSGSSFGDVATDAYYANSVTWAVANEITNGTGGNTFSPDVVVSRAQAVTFLYRELA